MALTINKKKEEKKNPNPGARGDAKTRPSSFKPDSLPAAVAGGHITEKQYKDMLKVKASKSK